MLTENSDVLFMKVITDVKNKKEYSFMIPDMIKLMNDYGASGDTVYIPVNLRKGKPVFWEMGGRIPKFDRSYGTIVCDDKGKILDAIIINKLKKKPNSKQALMMLKNGYNVYVGRLSNLNAALSSKIKVFKLVYRGIEGDVSDGLKKLVTNSTKFGIFEIKEVMLSYADIESNLPAKRLVEKLFTVDVKKPYFSNGWSCTNVRSLKDVIQKKCIEVIHDISKRGDDYILAGDVYIDILENLIVENSDVGKRSSVFQIFDFNNDTLTSVVLKGLDLNNITNTINKVELGESIMIELHNLKGCYNQHMLFENDDMDSLRLSMTMPNDFSVDLGEKVFGVIRAYKG